MSSAVPQGSLPSCSNCHAVLPDKHKILSCPYCNTPTGSAHRSPAEVAEERAKFMRFVYATVAIFFVAVPLYHFLGHSWNDEPEAKPVVQKADDLRGLGDTATDIHPLPTSGLGPLTAFDPLAQVPRLTALAATWAPDARLARLELNGVRPDGTMDLATPGTDAFARYQFVSAVRGALGKQQRRAVDSPTWSAVDVELKAGVLRATVVDNGNEDRPAAPLSFDCSVPKLLALWRPKGLPEKAAYHLELDDQRGPKPDFVWRSHDWGVPKAGMDCKLRSQ